LTTKTAADATECGSEFEKDTSCWYLLNFCVHQSSLFVNINETVDDIKLTFVGLQDEVNKLYSQVSEQAKAKLQVRSIPSFCCL